MKKANIILFVLLVACAVVFMFWWKPEPEVIFSTRIDTIPGDSIPYAVEVQKPVPVYIDTGSTRWRDRPIDTGAILADYFARVFYRDTLKNDTSALVIVEDTVTENRLQGRRLIFANRRPVAIIHTTTAIFPEDRWRVYVGSSVVTSALYNEISMGGKLQTGNWLFGYEYGLLHNSHTVGLYYNILNKGRRPP